MSNRFFAAAIVLGVLSQGLWGCASADKEVEAETEKPKVGVPTAADRQLVEDAKALQEQVHNTPAREHANRLNAQPFDDHVAFLTGEKETNPGRLGWARKDVKNTIATMKKGPDWPAPAPVHAARADQPVKVDGKLDDPVWQKATAYTGVYKFNDATPLDGPATKAMVAWDKDYLYVAFDCKDDKIYAEPTERDGPVYTWDCVEAFVNPSKRPAVYWEVIVSPAGSIFDGLHAKHYHKWGFTDRKHLDLQGLKTGVQLRGTLNDNSDVDDGYSVEFAIPFDEMPEYKWAEPQAGQELSIVLARLDSDGEKMTPYATHALMAWGHNIWNHAKLILDQ